MGYGLERGVRQWGVAGRGHDGDVFLCRRVDGVHHHKILTHDGIWRFEKAVSDAYRTI